MRLSTMLIAAAASFASIGAIAAPSATADVNAKMVAVQTIQGENSRHTDADAATLAGTYPLSNGQILHVSYERHRLFAEMGSRKTELVPTGATSFAGRGTSLQFVFDQVPFATDVVISSR
jgi:hypothetical protein